MRTLTDAVGGYTLYLDLGAETHLNYDDYRIVTAAIGYHPACAEIDPDADTDFFLTPVADSELVTVSGTITGTVAADADEPEPIVIVSFSKELDDCLSVGPFEVASVQVGEDDDDQTADAVYENGNWVFAYPYQIQVPAASYDVHARTAGLLPVVAEGLAAVAPETVLDLDFSQ